MAKNLNSVQTDKAQEGMELTIKHTFLFVCPYSIMKSIDFISTE